MNCNYCQKQFNDGDKVPRLLILCGHSLCEACCYQLHDDSKVECPECHSSTYVDAIASLPKNLALLTMRRQDSINICAKHEKKYEAFCEKQKMLICVDCILQDGHRNHPMQSIKNAYNKESTKMNKIIGNLAQLDEVLTAKISANKQNQEDSENYFYNMQGTITGIFKEIREIINSEQSIILNKMKQSYKNIENKFIEKHQRYLNNASKIEECLQQLKKYETSEQIFFLRNTLNRQQMTSSIPSQIEDPVKTFSQSYSKASLIQTVIKSLEKIGKNSSSIMLPSKKNHEIPHHHITAKVIKKSSTPTPIQKQKSVFSKKNQRKQSKTNQNTYITPIAQQKKELVAVNNPLHKFDTNINNNGNKCQLSIVEPRDSLFNSFVSSMTSFLTEKKFIYLVGGFGDQTNNILKFSLQTLQFEEVASMNSNRSKFGAVVIDRDLMLFGGKKGKERVADCEVWKGKWASCPPMLGTRSGFGIVIVQQFVYFIGGNDGNDILDTVQCLNLTNGQWSKKQSLIQARDELYAVLGNDGNIYAIGGFGGRENQPLRTVQIYDIKKGKWYPGPNMIEPRRALAAAVLADGIYAIGGFDGNTYMSSVEKLEESSNKWVEVASMKQPRCTHSAVSIPESQQIFVIGGFDYVALDTIEKFSIVMNQWETVCKMPNPRFMHASLVVRQ